MAKKTRKLKHEGRHTHRFSREPEELRFAEAWDTHNERGKTLNYLLSTDQSQQRPMDVSDNDRVVAATVIQWLGSHVGQCFLEDLGYVKRGLTKIGDLEIGDDD